MNLPPAQPDSSGPPQAAPQIAAWLAEYGDSVYAYARRRVESDLVAEELVQDTFLAALQNFNQFAGRSSPKTWLIAILRNKLIGHYRQRSKHRPQPLEDAPPAEAFDQQGIWKIPIGSWPRRPDQIFQQKEFWQAFDDCLAKLPPPAAEAFVLRVLDGLETENVCKTLNISSTNLAVRLHRARMALRNCLAKNWFGGD